MSITDSSPNPPRSCLIIHTDGGARGNPGPAATGVVIMTDSHQVIHAFGRYVGNTTNNVAEYSAVIDALNWLTHQSNLNLSLSQISFKLDSNLVVQQLNRTFKIKQDHLRELADKVWEIIDKHGLNVNFGYVPRAQNQQADTEVNRALDEALK